MRKLFKGGNYSRAETIRGNTVDVRNFMSKSIVPTKQIVVFTPFLTAICIVVVSAAENLCMY